MALCKKIMVTGTDTDVGKTVLSLLIMQILTAKGKNPFYVKPFVITSYSIHYTKLYEGYV